ncbi:MAG: PhzF family phenazine biosynthesis protein [Candidatus Nitrotoga sp.]
MNKPKFFITDVFTTKKYGGNQLATFVDCESLSDQEMQQIAKEINFSETTFITSRQPRNGGYEVRIFTPNAEVEFAGHPTLGTAHIIRNKLLQMPTNEIVLNLRVGQIPVTFVEAPTKPAVLWMKQMPPQFGKQLDDVALAKVLNIMPSDLELTTPIEEVSTGFPTLIVPLKNLASLKRAKIDKEKYFALVSDAWAKIILVFCREGYEPRQDLSVRVFGDYYGIPEDAATGSSNGCLAAYLARHKVFGKLTIDVSVGQGYEMVRPSSLALRTNDVQGDIEVFVGGSVVDVAEGVWR